MKILSQASIHAILDAVDKATGTSAMSEHQLVLDGYHQAIRDVRASLDNAARMADDDGSIPDYIGVALLVSRD